MLIYLNFYESTVFIIVLTCYRGIKKLMELSFLCHFANSFCTDSKFYGINNIL